MCCSSRSFTLINKVKQLLYMNSTVMDQSAMTLTTDVVYKYDGDTDIVTKYLTKSLFSILLQLFLHQNLKRSSDIRFSMIIGSE